MGAALGLFDLGYLCSKVLPVAVLGSVSSPALFAWLAAECAMLLVVRAALNQWRAADRAGDSASFSLLMHVCEFIIMLAAPFKVFHTPFILSPTIKGGFVRRAAKRVGASLFACTNACVVRR